jgi:hypothetical protein
MKLKKLFNNSGVVMTEALMAVTLMASAVIITGSIIESTVSTTKQTRDYAIAQNLLYEAVSGVENIINSNKILYPNNPACWLVYNTDPCDTDSNIPAIGSNYVASLENGRWILINRGKAVMDVSNTNSRDSFRLFKQNKTDGEDTFPMYTHDSSETNDESIYFRSIVFDEVGSDSVSFTVDVEWFDRSQIRRLIDSVTLYKNY